MSFWTLLTPAQNCYAAKKVNEVVLDIKSSWQIDGFNYIKLSGEIITPFVVLNHVQGSLQYFHQSSTKSYFLESYLNYSRKAEMKARAHLKEQSITLNLESSLEGLRLAKLLHHHYHNYSYYMLKKITTLNYEKLKFVLHHWFWNVFKNLYHNRIIE